MAEDQGVNGDLWNDRAHALLTRLGWDSLGDSNMDLPNQANGEHGVDRMFTYFEATKIGIVEGVLAEAKAYKTTSFKPSSLDDWIKTLDKKLSNIKNSEGFYDMFPTMDGVPLRTGLIVIWFSDITEYLAFKDKFKDSLRKVQIPWRNASPNKIYVIENDVILRLASLCNSVMLINTAENIQKKVQFYYPSIDSYPAKRSSALNPNYMVSKFILADFVDARNIENKLVFYFGKLNLLSFQRLRHALANAGCLDKDKPLVIYTYQRHADFRKIEPEVLKLFQDVQVKIAEMELFSDLPTFMRKV